MTEKASQGLYSTLLLEQPALVDPAPLVQKLGGFLGISDDFARQGPGPTLLLPVGPSMLMVLSLDIARPDVVADSVYHFMHWWPDAAKDVRRNRAHCLIRTSRTDEPTVDQIIRHMVIVDTIAQQMPVIAVQTGSQLVQPEMLRAEIAGALSRQPNCLFPASVSVLIQYTRQPNGNILISTLGMDLYGHMEVETESSLPLDQTFTLVSRFCNYIILTGSVVEDGNTFGLTLEQRIKVRHVRSFRPDVNAAVYWLELTSTATVKRPKGFFSRLFGSDRTQ